MVDNNPGQAHKVRQALAPLMELGSLGQPHPRWEASCQAVSDQFLFWDAHGPTVMHNAPGCLSVAVWDWAALSNMCNFRGCELLVIAAAGQERAIVASLLAWCRTPGHEKDFPTIIQVATDGLANRAVGPGTERAMLRDLEEAGFTLLARGSQHAWLADLHRPCHRVLQWIGTWWCIQCDSRYKFPYMQVAGGFMCCRCAE